MHLSRLPLLLASLLPLLLLGACTDSTVGTNNSAPSASIQQPAPGAEVLEGAVVTFVGQVADSGTPLAELEVTWISSLDGELASGTADASGRAEASADDLSVGEHTVTLQVRDAQGASGQASVTFAVLAEQPPNTDPTCAITAPTGTTEVALGALVLFEGTVGDAEQGAQTLLAGFSSNLDGDLGGASPSSAGAVALGVSSLTAGTHTVSLDVADDDGGTCSDFVVVTVVAENVAPSAPVVSIGPGAPGTGDDLVATLTTPSVDPDGGPSAVTYTWAWTRDGNAAGPFTPDDTVPASATTAGETWAVTVTAWDGEDASAPATDSVTVGNTPPSLVDAVITPTTAYTNTQLTVTPSGWSDADGDAPAYVYEWFADTAPVGTDAATLDASEFVKDEVITAVVTPVDASSSGASITAAGVTILNTLPTAPTVGISPSAPTDADPLTCSVSAGSYDADGDSVTYAYAWTNGSTTATGASLPASSTAAGQTWTCTVTPDDGDGLGPAGAASVSVTGAGGCPGQSPNTCGGGCASPSSCLNNWSSVSCAPPTVTAAYFTPCSSIPFSGATWCFVVEGSGFQLDYTTQGGAMKWGSDRSGTFNGSNWNWLYADQLVVTVGSWYSSYVGDPFWIENPDGQTSNCTTIGYQP